MDLDILFVDRTPFEELRAWVLLCFDLPAFVGCCVDACNRSVVSFLYIYRLYWGVFLDRTIL